MKKALKIVSILLAIVVLLPTIAVTLLNTNKVQNYLVDKVATFLSEEWGADVSVGRVDYRIPNHIKVDYLYLSDIEGDTLAFVSQVDGAFKAKALLDRQLIISSLLIDGPVFNLKKYADGTNNLQFLIDYFRRDQPKENKFQFQINQLAITHGVLSYRDYSDTIVSQGFSPKNIRVEQLNTQLSLDTISTELIAASVKQFSCVEQSGFTIDDFALSVRADKSSCVIPSLRLEMGTSLFSLNDVSVNYGSLNAFRDSLSQIQMVGEVDAEHFNLSKLSSVVPRLASFRDELNLCARFSGTPNNVLLDTIVASYGKVLSLSGKITAQNLLLLDSLAANGRIDALNFNMAGVQDLIANLRQQPFSLPKKMFAFGNATYTGEFDGRLEQMKLLGNLSTDLGSLRTDVGVSVKNHFRDINLDGCFSTKAFNLKPLVNDDLGSTAFDVDIALTRSEEMPMKLMVDGVIDAITYKGYTHHHILLDGEYQGKNINGHLVTNDENGSLEFDGNVSIGKESHKYQFVARIDDFSPYQMRLIKEYPNFDASLVLTADLEGEHIESLNGFVRIDSMLINNYGSYFLDSLHIQSKTNDQTRENHLSIQSPLISGMLYGKYTIASLTNHLMALLSEYMPLLNYEKKASFDNDLRYFIEISSTEQLCKVLDIPWYTTKPTTISGFYSDDIHRLNAEIELQHLTNGTRQISDAVLHAYNSDDQLRLLLSTDVNIPNDTMLIDLDVKMARDTISANLLWRNLVSDTITAGEFVTKACLFKQNDGLCVDAHILPTQIFLNDVPFEIGKSEVLFSPQKIEIDSFSLTSRNQHILIDGIASKDANDILNVELSNVSLDYIFSIVPLKAITLGGDITGTAQIGGLLSKPLIDASVSSENFTFNGTNYGHVEASTDVDLEQKRVNFNGDVFGERTTPAASLWGFYGMENDTIDINGHADAINLAFINHFTEGILDNIAGLANGDVHIYGVAKKGISVTAKAYVDSGQIGVSYLGTKYHFSDTLEL
ncbi:MAG: AsmA family protein, partial [Bacteroidales bacterium]|nr:AsmA family protein [Bacteroidales bacterium]